MINKQCRQADVSDWIAQIVTSTVKITLENIAQVEQEKPADKRDWRLQILLGLGIPTCNFITFEINKNLCVPIVALKS